MGIQDDLIELDEEQRQDRRLTLVMDRDSSPDRSARLLEMQMQTGLPVDFIDRNLEAVELKSKRAKFSPERFRNESPAFASWAAENPNHWAVVKDDYENLSGIEWIGKAFSASHEQGWLDVQLNRLYARRYANTATPADMKRIAELEKQSVQHEFGADDWFDRVVTDMARQLPQMEGAIKSGLSRGIPAGIGTGGMAFLAGGEGPQGLITVPAATALGFGVGFTTGIAEHASEQETGAAYREFLQIKDESGTPIDPAAARTAAGIVGVVNAGLEVIGMGMILKNVPGVKQLRDRIAKDAVKKALAVPTFRRAIVQLGRGAVQSIGGEVATEVLQESTNILAGELLKAVSPGDFKSLTGDEVKDRLWEIANMTLRSTLLIGGTGPVAQFVMDSNKARAAKNAEALWKALGEKSADSKLRERVPAKFREFVDRLREKGGVSEVNIDVNRFDEYFQSEGLDPEQVATEIMGSPEAYREAKAANTDLAIPIGDYAEKIAPTEHHNGLLKDLRLRADDMTLREAQTWEENREQLMNSIMDELPESGIGAAPEIYNDVLGQLLAAGHEQFAAERQAEVFESMFANLGQRTGIDPVRLYNRYPLRIVRPLPDILTDVTDFDTQVDPLIDRLRGRDIPTDKQVFGESLSDFLKARGGLQDDSELGARDAGKAIRGLIKKTGDTLDGAAEAAAEAGFIAEATPDALLEALDRELAGEHVSSGRKTDEPLQELRGALDSLSDYLDSLKVDLSNTDNAQVRALLLEPATFEQRFSPRAMPTGEEADALNDELDAMTQELRDTAPPGSRLEAYIDAAGEVFVANIEVPQDARGAGAGTALMEGLVQWADERNLQISLDPRADKGKKGALTRFYKRFGFRPNGKGRFYDPAAKGAWVRPSVSERGQNILYQSDGITSNQEAGQGGTSVLSEDGTYRQTTTVRERVPVSDAEQRDLFASTALSHDEEQQEARDNYKVLVRQEETSQIKVGLDTVKTVEDAAHVLAPFRRHAQESFFAIVTDKDDKIVNVIRHTKGTVAASSVYPAYVVGAVLGTPEAANVWFGHNHPSGNDQPSDDDVAITRKLTGLIEGSGVKHRGHAVVAAGGKMGAMNERGNVIYDLDPITPAPRRQTISVTERILRGRPKSDDVVMGPKDLQRVLKEVESPEGVLLMDNARAPLGFIAMSAGEMEKLRGTGGSSRLLAAIHFTNASAIAIKTESRAENAGRNMVDFAVAARVDLLDHMHGADLASHSEAGSLKSRFMSDGTFKQEKRGSITFNKQTRQATIRLFKAANLSTVLHESGHLYLEILGDLAEADDAPAQIVGDYSTLLKWFGVENRQAITREHHEQFARGFELYLREGKAPSIDLQKAFASFKAWLENIYRRIQQLDVEINDEVRGVFDRLIASDEAIATARQVQNYVELFSTPESAGKSPEEFAVYRRQVEAAHMEEESSLTAKLLAIETRESKKWWKAEREKMREDVAGEVHKMRVYRALALIRKGQNPDGTPSKLSQVKLDRAQLLRLYGKDFLKRLPRPYVYAAEGGVDVDTVAGLFGYGSGDEMIQEMVNARPMGQLIEAETDARMQEKYPDPLTDGSLAQNAMTAVHTDKRAELLAAEMKTLRRLARRDRPIVGAALRAQARQERESREVGRETLPNADERRVIKAAAEGIIGRRKVRDLRPGTYRTAEAKASRAAFLAAEKKDYETAYQEKRRQLLNHELFRAAERAQAQSESIRNYLHKFSRKRVRQRLGKAGEGLLEQIDLVLSDIDLRRMSGAAVDRNKARLELMKMIDEGAIIASPEVIARLQADSRENWIELSVEQFRGIRDIVKQLETRASRLSAMVINGEKLDIANVAGEIGAGVVKTNKRVYPGIGQETAGEGIRHSAKQARESWLRPASIARILDGTDFGPITKYIIVPMRRAYTERLIPMERKARDDMADLYNRFYSKAELGKFSTKFVVDALEANLSKSDILSMALNWGAEGNRQALLSGRRLDGMPAYTQAGVIEVLQEHLDARDWEFVQAVWDYLDSYWPELSATEKRRRGIAPKKVPASPLTIQTKDGQTVTVSGGYYPLKYDSRHGYRTKELEIEDHYKKIGNGIFVSANTRAGATHERVGSGGQLVRLGLGNIDRHLREIIRDMAIGDEVNFIKRVMENEAFRNAMAATGNTEAREALNLWLQDSAVGEMPAYGAIEQGLAYVRTGFTKAKLAWNALTTLLQQTGHLQSIAVVGQEAYAHGAGKFLSGPHQWHKHIMATSKFMQVRYEANTWNKDVADTQAHLGAIFGGGLPTRATVVTKAIAATYFWPIAKSQMLVDEITWLGAYWKGVEKEGLSDRDAIFYADAQVEKAQTSGIFSDRSGIERGTSGMRNTRQSQFIRIWTTLISYMLAKGNIAYEKGHAFAKKPTLKGAVYLATDVLLLFTMEAIASAVIYGRLPDDDDDEPWLTWLAKETALSAVSGVPFVREVYGARFNSGNTPVGALSKDLYDLYSQIAQGEIDRPLLKELNNVGGTLFHYPSSQTNRLIDGMWRENVEGEDVPIYEFITGERDYE